MIRQSDLSSVSILNYMEIGDDVAVRIPYDSRTRSLWDLNNIECEEIPLNRDGGDMDYRGRGLPKQPDS